MAAVPPGTAPDSGRSARLRRWAPVVENRRVAEATWWLVLESPGIARASRPGEFLMIGFGAGNSDAPFLPRPFSVGWRSEDGRIGLLVRIFGPGTRRLAALEPGDRLLLLGPLGRPFRTEPGRPILCVAGGVGLAPFIFLADEERRAGTPVRLLYGERTASRVFEPSLLEELTSGPVEVYTEDGSLGSRGRVMAGIDLAEDPLVMGCGPDPMLAALAAFAEDRGCDLQVSVEEHMGCGIGTCQGCVVRTRDGHWVKSCLEGPVFDAARLEW